MQIHKTKICNRCKKELPTNMFYRDSTKRDELHTLCKICRQKTDKKHYRKNKKRILRRAKKYYQNNREKKIEEAREYYLKNKEKMLLYKREYQKKNSKRLTKKANDRKRKRYHNDIDFRLIRLLRWRVWSAVKGLNKSKSTMELIGCSIDDLKIYLESQFVAGMSWDNQGEWHIDHIQPCNTFDLTKLEEQQKCFHYSNLRPLWEKDNISRPKDGSDLI